MEFEVYGSITGKQRARTFYDRRSMKMRSITPAKTKSYEDLIRWSFKASGGKYLEDAPISLKIIAYYEIPKSWSKKKIGMAESNEIKPCVKVDADNLAKVVLDALNGVAYSDDKQVVELYVLKRYSNHPKLNIEINEFN